MEINYTYRTTNEIQQNLIRIEATKKILAFFPRLPHIEELLRHKSLLKSSLFSARIEGNTLSLDEIENNKENNEDRQKKEVLNILRTLRWIHSEDAPIEVTKNLILKLHKMIMQDLVFDAGHLRTEPSAIFNQAGVAIYMTPPPSMLEKLIGQLISLSQKDASAAFDAQHGVIKTALVHFAFEKIHPFIDGNGRVGRILSSFMLRNEGYDFRGLATFEEYLNEHRDAYYAALSLLGTDITEFVEFFTDAVATSAEKVIEQLQDKKEEKPEDTLLPRRQEILAIIREHHMVSFDFIRRRFARVPESSLHYDLKMLLKQNLIKKLGATRGVLYSPK